MKTIQPSIITLTGLSTLTAVLLLSAPTPAAAKGTDIVHFTVIEAMTNNGVEPGAGGLVAASQKKQGNADNQTLDIVVTGLGTNTTYELMAVIDTDTNLTDIISFTTDAGGNAALEYRNSGKGKGGGKNSSALPSALNPVSLIREVDIVNSNLQAVLTADLTTPDKLQYQIKQDLSNGGNKATLQIEANSDRAHFKLSSTGLAVNTDYLLVFNGSVVQTNNSGSKGKLSINTLTGTPPAILDLRTVELWDTTSNVVLQANVP